MWSEKMHTICDDKHALRRFVAAVDAVEKEALGSPDEQGLAVQQRNLEHQGAKQSHVDADRLLLARLRDKETSHLVSEALNYIDNECRKEVDDDKRLHDDRRLIRALLSARSASEDPEKLLKIYNEDIESHEELKRCAERLHKFFSDEIYRDPESVILLATKNSGFVDVPTKQLTTNPETLTDLPPEWPTDCQRLPHDDGADQSLPRSAYGQATRSLEWMRHIIKRRLDVLSGIGSRLSRKLESASKVIFMAAVADAMDESFGQPLYTAVAKLTDVALATEEATDDDQVRSARRGTQKRRTAAYRSGTFGA
jgi:hypothetical protein